MYKLKYINKERMQQQNAYGDHDNIDEGGALEGHMENKLANTKAVMALWDTCVIFEELENTVKKRLYRTKCDSKTFKL